MELTIALSISPNSEVDKIVETLDSLPWDQSGVDLVIYSENTKKVKQIIKEEDLESTLLNGQMEVLFCEEPYSSDDTYMNIGLEDARTDYITFLKPGDTIEAFDPDLLLEKFDVGMGSVFDNSTAFMCYESGMLPLSHAGMIFNVNFLRNNYLHFNQEFIPRLFNILLADLENPEYMEGWGKYDIADFFTVYPVSETPLENELTLPESYSNLWNENWLEYNYYLRNLIWTRISRAAAVIITSYPEKQSIISKFYKYLLPENKVSILK